MKFFVFFLIIQFQAVLAFSQKEMDSIRFIYNILKTEPRTNKITYTNKISLSENALFFTTLHKKKILGYDPKSQKKIPLILSKSDKRILKESVEKAKTFQWNDNLFPESKMIPIDSLWIHIALCTEKNTERNRLELSKEEITSNINDRVKNCSTFQFSQPIFLQNRNIVIFYFMRLCGTDCGYEDLTVYRYENGAYVKWLYLGGGDF